jgi:beta-glucosidase
VNNSFPQDFLWGAATAAIQIEGATDEDGRGETNWDRFCKEGRTFSGDTPVIACDHYHRYRDDIKLMSELGIKAYRFSIAWARILPEGTGSINQRGLDFYRSLVDELLNAGITPFATLFHWDLPQTLEDKGGWLNRQTIDHYVHYTDIVSRALGDRVKDWGTFNEPQAFGFMGYLWGVAPPGHKDSTYAESTQVIHHLLVAHGKAIPVLRANSSGAKVGITLNMAPVYPASDSETDRAAASRLDDRENRWFADPLYKGEYPAERIALLGNAAPKIEAGDMQIISTPMDYLGLNYYTRAHIADDPEADNLEKIRYVRVPDAEYTDVDWEVYPDGLRVHLLRLARDYPVKEIYVTENGCASADTIDSDGQVHDPLRVSYLRTHFTAMSEAIAQGVPLKGYFAWSLMDNFEWSLGYSKRFGIIYVDYPSQRRIPKDSFAFYQQVIRNNRV